MDCCEHGLEISNRGRGGKLTKLLRWWIRYGGDIGKALERRIEKTGKVSEVYDDLPNVDSYDLQMWAAFVRLHHSRYFSDNRPQPLQVRDMIEYAKEFDLDPDETIELVSHLDDEFRTWWAETHKDN